MDLIVKMKFGSHLYGTNTVHSDVDYKGVFLPSKKELLLGAVPKCRNFSTNLGAQKNSQDDIDEEIYSLHYFLKLACQGQTVAIGYVLPIISKFYDDYGQRAKQAAENKNIDWKAVSHALRAAIQTKEILVNGAIHYPLRDAPFLLKVKSGRLDYINEVAPALEALMDEVETLVNASDLPEQVDTEYWDDFLCEVLETRRFKE